MEGREGKAGEATAKKLSPQFKLPFQNFNPRFFKKAELRMGSIEDLNIYTFKLQFISEFERLTAGVVGDVWKIDDAAFKTLLNFERRWMRLLDFGKETTRLNPSTWEQSGIPESMTHLRTFYLEMALLYRKFSGELGKHSSTRTLRLDAAEKKPDVNSTKPADYDNYAAKMGLMKLGLPADSSSHLVFDPHDTSVLELLSAANKQISYETWCLIRCFLIRSVMLGEFEFSMALRMLCIIPTCAPLGQKERASLHATFMNCYAATSNLEPEHRALFSATMAKLSNYSAHLTHADLERLLAVAKLFPAIEGPIRARLSNADCIARPPRIEKRRQMYMLLMATPWIRKLVTSSAGSSSSSSSSSRVS
jgi:hypothetical protein